VQRVFHPIARFRRASAPEFPPIISDRPPNLAEATAKFGGPSLVLGRASKFTSAKER
jgi:hypothetical protein